jgi:hypothetical protein
MIRSEAVGTCSSKVSVALCKSYNEPVFRVFLGSKCLVDLNVVYQQLKFVKEGKEIKKVSSIRTGVT